MTTCNFYLPLMITLFTLLFTAHFLQLTTCLAILPATEKQTPQGSDEFTSIFVTILFSI